MHMLRPMFVLTPVKSPWMTVGSCSCKYSKPFATSLHYRNILSTNERMLKNGVKTYKFYTVG